MENECSPYSLIWKMLGQNDPMADRFYVPTYDGYLPFFVFDEDIDHSKGIRFEPNEQMLLLGICYGLNGHYYNENSYPSLTKRDLDTYHYLFGILAQGFQFPNPEEAFLTLGNYLSNRLGKPWATITLLETGLKFLDLHHNTAIKSNLCLAYWQAIDQINDPDNQASIAHYLLETIATMDISLNLPTPNAAVGIAGIQASLLLGDLVSAKQIFGKFTQFMPSDLVALCTQLTQEPQSFAWMQQDEILPLLEKETDDA